MRQYRKALAWAALATMGCGGLPGLANGDYSGSVASIRGELRTNGETITGNGPYGVTVLWLPSWVFDLADVDKGEADPVTGGNPFTKCPEERPPSSTSKFAKNAIGVSKAVMYGDKLPTSFVLPLDEPPPAAALMNLAWHDGRGTAAIGTVIAFVDANGNGQYDLGKPGSEPEKIVAASIDVNTKTESRAVLYLNGILPRSLPWPEEAQQGFNIVIQGPTRIATEPNSTPIHISTAFAEEYSKRINACAEEEFRSEYGHTPPAGVKVRCTPFKDEAGATGAYYTWFGDLKPAACTHVNVSGSKCFAPGQSIPPEWPACSEK